MASEPAPAARQPTPAPANTPVGGHVREGTIASSPDTESFFHRADQVPDSPMTAEPAPPREALPDNIKYIAAAAAAVVIFALVFVAAVMML